MTTATSPRSPARASAGSPRRSTLHAHGIDATVVDSAHRAEAARRRHQPAAPRRARARPSSASADELARHRRCARGDRVLRRTAGSLLFREPRGIDGGYSLAAVVGAPRPPADAAAVDAVRDRLGPDAVRTGARADRLRRIGRTASLAHTAAGALTARRPRRRRRHPLRRPRPAAPGRRSAAVVGRADVPRRGDGRAVPRRRHDGDHQGRQRRRPGDLSDRRRTRSTGSCRCDEAAAGRAAG